jgi:cyclopropane-fatty-acyl-phospholipid synthase
MFPEPDRLGLSVIFWDGTSWGCRGRSAFTLVLRHPGAVRSIASARNELLVGEGYIYDDYDIDGDAEAACRLGASLPSLRPDALSILRMLPVLWRLPQPRRQIRRRAQLRGRLHSRKRDREAIAYHYDISSDFYSLWLDQNMVYSCGYFERADDTLDAAQVNKLDYVCRKLDLRPGERFLDVGCGWGGLLVHAARHYSVTATGITLSRAQADVARLRIHRAGLDGSCRVELRDYRDVERLGPFDKVASVGMFEHVGESKLADYFSCAARLVERGGMFLNHGIARSDHHPAGGPSFVGHHVFPDGELVPLHTTLRAAERSGWEVRDVENLREHYVLTLRHWVRRLEERAEQVRALTDDVTYRTWRLFMAGSAHAFDRGHLQLFQTLMVKKPNGASGMPLTRRG